MIAFENTDFVSIDPNEDHWTCQDGYWVPAVEVEDTGKRLSDMTDAMMSEIPGQDDTVTPLKLTDQRFYKFCKAYLMQDGDLGVPGGRYGSSTSSCSEVAIIVALIMQYHSGEPISYYQLNSDMGLVVNSSDDIAYLLFEYGELIFDGKGFGPLGNDGFDIADWLDEDEINECRERHAAEYGE